uniref:C-type lectin domain-containing protein n=1 Tax=Mastacembelus armatus TaxID=205130 RepID=A0A7N8WZ09_9TELE
NNTMTSLVHSMMVQRSRCWWAKDISLIMIISVVTGRIGAPATKILVETPMTWADAQRYCRDSYTDLLSVRKQSENQEMANTWIGLYKGEVSRWMWSDGSGPVKLRWGIDPLYTTRNESCGQIHDTGLWDAALCGNSNGYVCYERE